ncbi:hypothetical protein K439DRAFT_1631700 [Ramaria rubella]|nr:hypothetical protein K439DRAFT_1631700 [Ramaria rubella]
MAMSMETPSRILRRIEALEAQDSDLPSLPSFPAFDDSGGQSFQASSVHSLSPKDLHIEDDEQDEDLVPYQSTPAPMSSHSTRSTMGPPSTSSSVTRFANSMRASVSTARRSQQDSFEISEILPAQNEDSSSSASIPDVYLPPEGENTADISQLQEQAAMGPMQITALHTSHVSPSPRDFIPDAQSRTPGSKKYDYSVSLRSEPKGSPLPLGRNVSVRKPMTTRTRTPSLSRTTPSPTSTSSNSTPRSTYSALARDIRSPALSRDERSQFETQQGDAASEVDNHDDAFAEAMQDPSGAVDEYFPEETHNAHFQVTQDGHVQEVSGDERPHDEAQDEHLQEADHESSPEPTFSSEEHIQSSSGSTRARTPFPNAFSSPIPSNTSTPMPAFAPRVLNPMVDATATPIQGPSRTPDDLATPYNRRRSFLLSLVHSTTRPRMAIPTPRPQIRAAPTPRPRSHPLAQTWTPSPSHLNAGPKSNPSSGSSDRLSFISTASSHDLTVHPRANASFDPVTGAKGVGKFNAVKLNSYLHGLNRRLQEENETLVSRLRLHGEEVQLGIIAEELERDGFQGVEEAVLGEVEAMRDALEKGELERDAIKAESDALAETLRAERDEIKNQLEAEQEGRKRDKERWKERMAEVESGVEGVIRELERRLEESERNASVRAEAEEKARVFEERVRELEERALEFEEKAHSFAERACEFEEKNHQLEEGWAAMEEDLDVAKRRAEKAEDALATSSDLGAEVKEAYEHAAAYKEEVRVATERASQLERQLREVERSKEELRASSEHRLAELDVELRQSLESQQSAEAHALELESDVKTAEERIEEVEDALTAAQHKASQLVVELEDVEDKLKRQEKEATRAAQSAQQMEDALEESERKMIADGEELTHLRTKVTRLERELESLRERSRGIASLTGSVARNREPTIPEVETEELEAELDEAHREIGRLNHLLSESPSRKAVDKAKDMRIELLEKEKDDLTDRVRSLTSLLAHPPNKTFSPDHHSPANRRQVLACRTPKTPGPPLKDFSWLHDKTGGSSASPLVAQIEYLQQELHLANDSIDEKVNRLEEAGMGIVGLTEKLEDAQARIPALEEEVRRLERKGERRVRRLARARCLKCRGRVNLSKLIANDEQSSIEGSTTSLLSDPPTPPSKTTEALRSALKNVNSELSTLRLQWNNERNKLIGERAVLQDAASRLNKELGTAKSEAKRALENGQQENEEGAKARANIQAELETAKSVVNELEEALKAERTRLRALSTEQSRVVREKEGILVQLERAQSDMDDVRAHLENVKRNNRELEAELRATATVDQKARLLEAKVVENQDVIQHLRDERESLAADQAALQRRYVEASAQIKRLRQELSTSQTSHDEHRHQLDLRVNEIEELRRELSQQARALEKIESEKDQAQMDRNLIVRTVTSLESDLKRIRGDAEVLGQDLKELKLERDRSETRHRDELGKADRAQKQVCAQLRLANEQLEAQRDKTRKAIAEFEGHVCPSGQQEVEELRTQHRTECKGLMVQIRYLKAKYTRESVFRADLGYQKHYLLGILSSFKKEEKQILAAVARIGFPLSQDQPHRKRLTLRTVASVALFVAKARRASENWREQSAPRTAVAAALQDVRRRRIAGSLGYA